MMKYLFFDIECADGGKATICSFGYVIADMDFNVIEKRDILINPESEFCLEGRNGRPDVKLGYPEEEFLKAPTFDKVYDEIKALVESKEYYAVGHSVENDIKFLNMACKRYGMPPLEFEYFDTQRTYKDLRGAKRAISLQNALIEFGLDSEIVFHRSDEDARATMLVLKALLERSNKKFVEYAQMAYSSTGRTFDFYWGWNGQIMSEYNDVYYVKYTKDFIREILPGEENYILRSNENYVNFQRFIRNGAPIGEKSELLARKVVCVSPNYESYHYRQMLFLVGLIKAAGGSYTRKVTEADVFVTWFFDGDGNIKNSCTRLDELEKIEEKRDVSIVGLADFLASLGLDLDSLESAPMIHEDYFLEVREL